MFKKILIGLVVLIAGFAILVAVQPSDFKVTRSATFTASPADVFAQVNDFHKWKEWSPWAKLDPKAKNSFEGAESGEGAIFKWSGNSEIGEGSMKIAKSVPNERIAIDLDFTKPFEGHNDTEFTFKADGDKTKVIWTNSGKLNFVAKAICLFVSMDKMIGGKFDEGLASIKTIVETKTEPQKDAPKTKDEKKT